MIDMLPIQGQRVIVAALHWGLGHAARCIPIVHQLLRQGNQVAIASDGDALLLLRNEFPSIQAFTLPSYNIKYRYSSMSLNMLIGAPSILLAIRREHQKAEKLVHDWQADIIISDNRLGFRSRHTHNIYITHQLQVLAGSKFQSRLATRMHAYYYHKFDECWIPDYAGADSLAGRLSVPIGKEHLKITHIGPVSRLATSKTATTDKKFKTVAILSGPEPQRTTLENIIITIAAADKTKSVALVRGTTKPLLTAVPSHVSCFDLADQQQLQSLIDDSGHIICRAGYTSIMDLVEIGRGATLVPTPGQTEQEYLGSILNGKYKLTVISQKHLTKQPDLIYGGLESKPY